MPTYEYICRTCNNQFEEFQAITAPALERCPACGGHAERKISGGTGLIFKGSGFYITDYKKSGEKGKSEAGESSPASSDTTKKPDSGSSTPSKPA